EVEHTYTSVPSGGRTNVTICVQFISGPESCQAEMITVNLSLSGYISHSSQLEPLTSDGAGAVHFTIEVWGGLAPYSYQWQFGDGTISTNHSVLHEFFETGMKNVTVEIIDARGNYINLSAQIDIIDSDGNEGDGTKIDVIEELPIETNAFGIVFTGGGALFLSTLIYSNGKKNREKIMEKGRLLAKMSSSSVEDSYWADSTK
ncbi:MAG TPA: PKD domain-containing protein, partial [Candidatus Poseidoniales archaeon]|nr:PKD domain-containing protein [Candidatus Poseidoniales archaeon]